MGLLDSVIGGVLGQVLGGGQRGGGGSAMSPLVKALLMLLMAKGASGGFGDIFGRGHGGEPGPDADRSEPTRPVPNPYGQDGPESGGWDQDGARRDTGLPPGDFSDLSGMLDGPGDGGGGPARDPGAGPYAHLDRELGDRPDLGGLDGLIDGFRKGGLGEVIESWIGHGPNHAVQPNQLAQALGPDTLGTLERETGMSRDTLLSQLAQVLPQVIDGLTPQGRVPGEGERRGW